MKIIISPAKTMNNDEETLLWETLPVFLDKTREIKEYLSGLPYDELKNIWKCNDKIAELNYRRIQNMELDKRLVPALLAYEGLQYQSMSPEVFDEQQWQYVKEHLLILSGFYGVLRAMDGITPYRLEMQAKLDKPLGKEKNLYAYWGDTIYKELTKDSSLIVNLASKEYSKVIEKYLTDDVQMITCVFGSLVEVKGEWKVKVKATEAKMARGEMVRYLARHQVEDAESIKEFDSLGYVLSEENSDENNYVFLKK